MPAAIVLCRKGMVYGLLKTMPCDKGAALAGPMNANTFNGGFHPCRNCGHNPALHPRESSPRAGRALRTVARND